MVTLFLMIASTLGPAATNAPDFNRLVVFATIERSPSFERTTRIRIGVIVEPNGAPGSVYWFLRDAQVSRGKFAARFVANSKTCPSAVPILRQLEQLQLGRPDVPKVGRHALGWPKDGTSYTLRGTSRHPDGQPGEYSASSNIGSPLAIWTDRLLSSLAACWSKLPG